MTAAAEADFRCLIQAPAGGKLHNTARPYRAAMPITNAPTDPAGLVQEWSRGLASLSAGQPPCPGFKPDEWIETLTNARRFVEDFGLQAAELGWDPLTLFGVGPTTGAIRADFCQRCHMLHDRSEHQRRRRFTLLRRKAMGDLFHGPYSL